jgi:hypothetical protein
MDQIIKQCGCGARYTLAGWFKLRYRGIQRQIGGPDLELRDCGNHPCKSTLALEVDETARMAYADAFNK